MALGVDTDTSYCGPLQTDADEIVEVEPGFKEMREALVEHYSYVWNAKEVMWMKTRAERAAGTSDEV